MLLLPPTSSRSLQHLRFGICLIVVHWSSTPIPQHDFRANFFATVAISMPRSSPRTYEPCSEPPESISLPWAALLYSYSGVDQRKLQRGFRRSHLQPGGGAGGKRTSAHRHKSYDDKEEAKWEKRQRVTSKQQKRGRGEKTKSSSSILDHFSSSLAPCFGSTQQQLFCS